MMHTSMFMAGLLIFSIINQSASAQGSPSPDKGTSTDELLSFVEQERQLLAPFKLTPIVVPKGERVGDTFHPKRAVLIAAADDCFPGLKARKDFGQLPSVTTFSEKGLAAALGASGILDAQGGTTLRRAYVLSFRDVEVQTVSISQLRSTMRQKSTQECEAIRPYIDALYPSNQQNRTNIKSAGSNKIPPKRVASLSAQISDPTDIPIVIGTVYSARRVLRVALSEELDAKAKLTWGQSFLQTLGLDAAFKVSAEGASLKTKVIEFVGDSVIPVAYAPIFEITGTNIADAGQQTIQISEISHVEIQQKVASLNQFLANFGRPTLHTKITDMLKSLDDNSKNSEAAFLLGSSSSSVATTGAVGGDNTLAPTIGIGVTITPAIKF